LYKPFISSPLLRVYPTISSTHQCSWHCLNSSEKRLYITLFCRSFIYFLLACFLLQKRDNFANEKEKLLNIYGKMGKGNLVIS
jgi:hypothetical protein